jgi:GNAT superfamily N-acetyltransferase
MLLYCPWVPRTTRDERRMSSNERGIRGVGENRPVTTDPPAAIALAPARAAADDALVGDLARMVNDAYAIAEHGIWAPGGRRVDAARVRRLIEDGELAVARADGQVAGCVRVRALDASTGELGLLVSAPAYRGRGLGRALVTFAEERCRARGARAMRLELLVPRDWRHPGKEALHRWYTRRGYRVVGERPFEDALARFVTPCLFRTYERALTQ